MRDTHKKREKNTLRDTHIERHTQRHTDTFKLKWTHTLRETPSSRKRHTVLRARHTHTQTEGEKHKQGE